MSYVNIHIVNQDGTLTTLTDVADNGHAFHVAIWNHLASTRLRVSGYPSAADLDRLWDGIGMLPRPEGIALAATFDRCWFTWSWRDEVCAALRAASSYASTCNRVADILAKVVGLGAGPRGFAFSASVADTWQCSAADDCDMDDLHHLDDAGTQCTRCNTADIIRADRIVHP